MVTALGESVFRHVLTTVIVHQSSREKEKSILINPAIQLLSFHFYSANINKHLAAMLVLQIAFDFHFTSALKMAFGPEAREAAPTNDFIFATRNHRPEPPAVYCGQLTMLSSVIPFIGPKIIF